uniref:40S ribosomal protein S21 n=1 Tax=Amazona collaria TaxID=241587 RepID=A0A8B9IX07_9PSIT
MGGRFPSGSWRHEEWRPSKGVWGRTRPLRADTRAPHPLKGRAAPAPRFLHSPHSGRAAQRPSRPLTPFLHAGSGLLPAGLFPLPPPALFPFPPRHTRGRSAMAAGSGRAGAPGGLEAALGARPAVPALLWGRGRGSSRVEPVVGSGGSADRRPGLAPRRCYRLVPLPPPRPQRDAERRRGVCGPLRPTEVVDKVTGRVNGQFKTYAICGPIRRMGESDDSILRLAKNDGIVSKNF